MISVNREYCVFQSFGVEWKLAKVQWRKSIGRKKTKQSLTVCFQKLEHIPLAENGVLSLNAGF